MNNETRSQKLYRVHLTTGTKYMFCTVEAVSLSNAIRIARKQHGKHWQGGALSEKLTPERVQAVNNFIANVTKEQKRNRSLFWQGIKSILSFIKRTLWAFKRTK